MITTDFVPGSPCWIDIGARDVKATADFYGKVFGWSHEPAPGGEEMEYGLFRQDGKTVGGIGRLDEEGARQAWMIYFATDDVEAATKKVEQAGGTVRVRPMGDDDMGRMAQFTDPQGGQFAVFQGGMGIELVDAPNGLCWTELYTPDKAGALVFYGALFGWRSQDTELPGGSGTYTMITPAGQPDERMHGGLMEADSGMLAATGGRAYWHPVFAVADCDATLARLTEHGGRVVYGPDDAEGVGRLAVCLDPSGEADFVILKPEPGAG